MGGCARAAGAGEGNGANRSPEGAMPRSVARGVHGGVRGKLRCVMSLDAAQWQVEEGGWQHAVAKGMRHPDAGASVARCRMQAGAAGRRRTWRRGRQGAACAGPMCRQPEVSRWSGVRASARRSGVGEVG